MALAAKYNLAFEQGATFTRVFQLLDGFGVPLDLTGYTIDAHIRIAYNDPTASAQFTTVKLADPGTFSLNLPSTTTATLGSVAYLYDVRLTSGSTVIYPMEGKVTVSRQVTK